MLYYRSFPNDAKFTKSLVGVLYIFHGRAIITHHSHGDRFSSFGRSFAYHKAMLNSILSTSVLDTVHVCLVCDSFWDMLLHARPLQKASFARLSRYVCCSPSLAWNQLFAGFRQLNVRVDCSWRSRYWHRKFCRHHLLLSWVYILQGYHLWVVLTISYQVFVMIIVQRWVLLLSFCDYKHILGSFFCLRVWKGGNIVLNRLSSIHPSLNIVSGGNRFIVTIIVSSEYCCGLNVFLIPKPFAQGSVLCDSIR